jgi:predicted nucleotidyltransferase
LQEDRRRATLQGMSSVNDAARDKAIGVHPAIAAMVEQIRRIGSVERIILFGSRARGDHDERSDIDLAIACPGASPEEWTAIWNIADEAPTLLKVDLVRLEHVDDALQQEIEREGVVLYACR